MWKATIVNCLTNQRITKKKAKTLGKPEAKREFCYIKGCNAYVYSLAHQFKNCHQEKKKKIALLPSTFYKNVLKTQKEAQRTEDERAEASDGEKTSENEEGADTRYGEDLSQRTISL